MKSYRYLFLVSLAVLLFALTGCGKKVSIGSEANLSKIVLEKGQVLVLKLASNPTTGYDWGLTGLDTSILQQKGEVAYKSDSALIGSGGVDTWMFEAVGSGQTHLQLVYHRSWEKDIPPLETFDLDIVVK